MRVVSVRLQQLGALFTSTAPLLQLSFPMATSRSKATRDPVLVRVFQFTGHSYEDGIAYLLARLRDSLARTAAQEAVTHPPAARAPSEARQ